MDLDSFYADFGLSRLAASAAVGLVTFSRFSPTQQATIYPGVTVQTTDGAIKFAVTVDTSNPHYDAGVVGYVIPVGTASVTVPVQSTSSSLNSNVVTGLVTVMTSAIPGVDTVTNAAAFTGGSDPESDSAFRTRFQVYIASLTRATNDSVSYAVAATQLGLTFTIRENYSYAGALVKGFFYVVVDDGSGAPPQSLLDTIYSNVDSVRPLGTSFEIHAATVVTADIAMTVTVSSGNGGAIRSAVETAIADYINSRAVGATLSYTALAQIAYNVSSLISNVSGVTLNSATADLAANSKQVIKAGTVTIN